MKSPNTSEVYYKKTLSWIVQECKASFILSNKKLFKDNDDFTTKSLATVVECINVDWLCVTTDTEVECPTKGLSCAAKEDADLLSSAEKSEVKKEEAGGFTSAAEEVRKEDLSELHLDSAKPENIVFLQFTTSGRPTGRTLHFFSHLLAPWPSCPYKALCLTHLQAW